MEAVLCSEIKLGERHRKDMGDLQKLADSIKAEGLLQPIGINEEKVLVFGERRLRAIRDILGWETIDSRLVKVSSIAAGEYAENEIRKDFTTSERVAIGEALEEQIGDRQGQRTDRELVEKIPQVEPGEKTRDVAAEKAGFGNPRTYQQAKKVCEEGTPALVAALDEGKISISAAAKIASKRDRPPGELATIAVELLPTVKKKFHKGAARDLAAKLVGVGAGTVQQAMDLQHADPELFAAVRSGEKTLAQATKELATGKEEKSKRQKAVERAAKERMVKGLGTVSGVCTGLADIDIRRIQRCCDNSEIQKWAQTCCDLGKQLQAFGRRLQGGSQ